MSSTSAFGGQWRCGFSICILDAHAVAWQQDGRSASELKLCCRSLIIRSVRSVAVKVGGRTLGEIPDEKMLSVTDLSGLEELSIADQAHRRGISGI